MIFPRHRIKEQLKTQADLTEEEAQAILATMAGYPQGTIAPEDFSVLGHRLIIGGHNLPAGGAGNFNQIGIQLQALSPPNPEILITERIVTLNPMEIRLIDPSSGAAFNLIFEFIYRDVRLFGKTNVQNINDVVTMNQSNAIVPGTFLGKVPAGESELEMVLLPGWGIVLRNATANVADEATFHARTVDLRVK